MKALSGRTGITSRKQARLENVRASVLLLADLTAAEIEKAKSGIEHESLAIPLPGLAVAVNPTAVPGLGVSGLGR